MEQVKSAVRTVAHDVATGLERHLVKTIGDFASSHIEPREAMSLVNEALEANKVINILNFSHTQLYQEDGLPQYTSDKYPSEKLNFRECKDGKVTTERPCGLSHHGYQASNILEKSRLYFQRSTITLTTITLQIITGQARYTETTDVVAQDEVE